MIVGKKGNEKRNAKQNQDRTAQCTRARLESWTTVFGIQRSYILTHKVGMIDGGVAKRAHLFRVSKFDTAIDTIHRVPPFTHGCFPP